MKLPQIVDESTHGGWSEGDAVRIAKGRGIFGITGFGFWESGGEYATLRPQIGGVDHVAAVSRLVSAW